MSQPSQQAVHAVGVFEIHHVKLAIGFEHSSRLTQRSSLLFHREMVEPERRKHSIERRLGIRQLISKSLIELNRDRRPLVLAPVLEPAPWGQDQAQPPQPPDEA